MSSLELFVSHSDFKEMSTECKESTLYVTLFVWVQFNALFVSASFFFSVLGSRIIAKILDIVEFVKWKRIDNLFVFWGLDDDAVLLAKSVYERIQKDKKNINKIAIIVLPLAQKKSEGRLNFSKIFSSADYDTTRLEKLSYIKNETIIFSSHAHISSLEDIIINNGLGRLGRMINRSINVNVFFMAESEKQNITSADMFSSSQVIKDRFNKKGLSFNLKIYCQAARRNENLIQEKVISMKNRIDISFIDTAYLAVLSMKVATSWSKDVCPDELLLCTKSSNIPNYANHPVNFVDYNNGVVTSDFTSMIIGFGETGQFALDFLYEFGSFAGSYGEKSQFKCHVYDDKADSLWTRYTQRVPYFKTNSSEIEIHNYSPNTKKFWDEFYAQMDSLNYIVICMGNDNATLTVLGEIYEAISHNRNNGFGRKGSERLHICIRAYSEENELLIKRTLKAYNELAGDEVIRYFGMPSKIYTISKIDDEELTKMSRLIDSVYNNATSIASDAKQTSATTSLSYEAEYEFQSKRRKDYANKEQGLHLYTKKKLLGEKPTDETIENVAIAEHIRWCSSHFVQGYLPMTKEQLEKMPTKNDGSKITCSERLKRHACLVPFAELSEEEKNYDRAFVKKAIEIINKQ